MNPKLITGLVSAVLSSAAMAQPTSSTAPLTRAEVLAETHLWKRAGLMELDQGDGSSVADQRYERRLGDYQRMRDGAEFSTEVRRAQDRGASDHTHVAWRPVPMSSWN